jgi:SpoVK/Ycf46/Vps4 family AAA+-type ATPase
MVFEFNLGIFGGEGDIFIIGVTRDDKLIDEAVLRPGRLDIHIEVDLPNDEERSEMFRSVLEKMPTKIDDEQLLGLVEKTKEYTRGGIVDLCREAGMVCIRNGIDEVSINEFKI